MDFVSIVCTADWNAQATTSAVLLTFLLLEAFQNLIAYAISPSILKKIKNTKNNNNKSLFQRRVHIKIALTHEFAYLNFTYVLLPSCIHSGSGAILMEKYETERRRLRQANLWGAAVCLAAGGGAVRHGELENCCAFTEWLHVGTKFKRDGKIWLEERHSLLSAEFNFRSLIMHCLYGCGDRGMKRSVLGQWRLCFETF